MKKLVAAVLCAVIIIGAFCTFFILYQKNKNKVVYANSLSTSITTMTLNVNCSYCFGSEDYQVMPKNCTEKIFLSTNDSEVLDLNTLSNNVLAKKVGQCILFLNIKSSETEMLSKSLQINVVDNTSAQNNSKVETTKLFSYKYDTNACTKMLTYDTESPYTECVVSIISGGDIVEILTASEYKTLYIKLKGIGDIEIVVDSPLSKTTFQINAY